MAELLDELAVHRGVERGRRGKGNPMRSKRGDDELEGVLPSGLDADCPKDRDMLERLSAKLLRLEREAMQLAATMRQKPKPS